MIFNVVQNDITNMSVDAIVLPANEHLREGSGTSHAIFKKAGRLALAKACRELGSCRIGEAVPTLAFNLDSNYIIHAVVPKWIDGTHQEYEYLCAAYLSALNVADLLKCKSIAFPLLAAGNNGFDLDLAYRIACESIHSFSPTNLENVTLVVFGDTIATFVKGKGVNVVNLQSVPAIGRGMNHMSSRRNRLYSDGKKVAASFLEDQIAKAIDYLKKEDNREKVLKAAIDITKMAIKLVAKK